MIQIGIIGSGAMGAGIAQVAATAGHQVIVFDTDQNALKRAKVNLESTLKKLVEKQKLTQSQADNIISSIPALLAARIFSFIPPTGKTLPLKVISPVRAIFFLTFL